MDWDIFVDSDDGSHQFYSGSLVRGRIVVNATAPQVFSNIYVHLTGDGHTEWSEGSGKEKKTFTGDLNVLRKTISIKRNEDDVLRVSVGVHEYPFEIPLPYNLPSTMDVTYGNVSYKLHFDIDIPMSVNRSTDYEFNVIKRLNLNNFPLLKVNFK